MKLLINQQKGNNQKLLLRVVKQNPHQVKLEISFLQMSLFPSFAPGRETIIEMVECPRKELAISVLEYADGHVVCTIQLN